MRGRELRGLRAVNAGPPPPASSARHASSSTCSTCCVLATFPPRAPAGLGWRWDPCNSDRAAEGSLQQRRWRRALASSETPPMSCGGEGIVPSCGGEGVVPSCARGRWDGGGEVAVADEWRRDLGAKLGNRFRGLGADRFF